MNEIIKELQGRIQGNFQPTDILFHCRVHLRRHIIKKNNRPIFYNKASRRPFLGKSKELTESENILIWSLKSRMNQLGIEGPILGDLWLVCHFYMDNYFTKKNKRSKTIGDLSNLIQLPEDCLQLAGVIESDTQICSYDLTRRLPGSENEIEIFLLRFHEEGLWNSKH